MPVAKTFCRICAGFCAMDVTLENGRVVDVRGDREDPVTRGYTCIKGLQNPELLNGELRIRQSLHRNAQGHLEPVPVATAFDEIAVRLRRLLDAHGPRSIAIFIGTQGWFNAINQPAARAFAAAIGTPAMFGTMTIDQSAKWVADERIGTFNGGVQRFGQADVWMLVGTNPLVSVMGGPSTSGFANLNPAKSLKDARARGMKLIVIDPRLTETARHADLLLRPFPGEDAVLLAGILHVVLREGWFDADFCQRYVDGIDALRQAIAAFDPESVAARTGVPQSDIVTAARMFGLEARTGRVGTGTGTDMGPHSNIAEHLAQCLNVVCGRFLREGDLIPNPGVLTPMAPRHADVSPPRRSWMQGPVTHRLGLGMIYGEMMAAEMADEMLHSGPERIRALICLGSNPAVALPEQEKAIRALRSLDTLVTIDPRMSATAKLADYVIAPKLAFERHDHTGRLEAQFLQPYARYAPPIVDPPEDAEVVEEWQFFWEVAKRMQVPMALGEFLATRDHTPDSETMIASTLRDSRVPLSDVRANPGGAIYESGACVLPARPGWNARLQLVADDVLQEIAEVEERLRGGPLGADTLILTVRRAREFINSVLTDGSRSRSRIPENPVYVHPDTAQRLGLETGQRVAVASKAGSVEAVVELDDTLLPEVVAMTHCWGKGTDDPDAIPESTSRLVASDTDLQTINGMPVMNAIPVVLRKLPGHRDGGVASSSARRESEAVPG